MKGRTRRGSLNQIRAVFFQPTGELCRSRFVPGKVHREQVSWFFFIDKTQPHISSQTKMMEPLPIQIENLEVFDFCADLNMFPIAHLLRLVKH
jgi:hypothetical protein